VPSRLVIMQVSLSFGAGMRWSATDHRPLSWQALAETAPAGVLYSTTP